MAVGAIVQHFRSWKSGGALRSVGRDDLALPWLLEEAHEPWSSSRSLATTQGRCGRAILQYLEAAGAVTAGTEASCSLPF